MRTFLIIVTLCWLNLGSCCAVTLADGGRVVLMERQGDYRISVFTSPDPLRAGPIDISVLFQDSESGKPITNARIYLTVTPSGRRGQAIHAIATNAAATNKLLSAALLDLRDSGLWDVDVFCSVEKTKVQVRFVINAAGRSPQWLAVWPWFGWPAGVVMLFGIHRSLISRRKTATTRIAKLLQR